MVSSTRQAIAGIFILLAIISAQAQQASSEKIPNGSISGTVTVKGKPVAGIVVVATNTSEWQRQRYRATSDHLGYYSITRVPAGNYEIEAAMRSFVSDTQPPTRTLLISDGENIENLDFALLRGGVITGRVTDPDGQPLIEEQIQLMPAEGLGDFSFEPVETDDRGVYRFFGLRPGKYKVAAGQHMSNVISRGPRPFYKQTFYPSVVEAEKATIVEVKEGSENNNIDIVISRAVTGFNVSGRVVDSETGKPVPRVQFGIERNADDNAFITDGGPTTNAAGEFKFENLTPGNYAIFVLPGHNVRSDRISFELVDHDIKDLVIKTTKGAIVSGVVVVEGSEDKVLRPRYGELMVYAQFEVSEPGMHLSPQLVAQDGTFTIGGLPNGKARFKLFDLMRKPGAPRWGVVRIERNGVPQADEGIELKDGDVVAGLRIVVKQHNGRIRGVVKVEKGETTFTYVELSLVRVEDDPEKSVALSHSDQVDSRGRFLIEGVAPGTYVMHIHALPSGGKKELKAKQQVTVTNNTVAEVTITLADKPDPEPF